MRRIVASVLMLVFAAHATVFAVGGKNAQYVGGTVVGVPEKAEGRLDTSSPERIVFSAKKSTPLAIAYSAITELEYGQHAGRRVGVAIMVSPLALFSKKRKHYLTIGYKDEQGTDQAAIFELGKDVVRTTLKVIETRSGKSIEYQDEEARKSGMGGKG